MLITLESIPMREVLHYLGWRGAPVEKELLHQLEALSAVAIEMVRPRAVMLRFAIGKEGTLDRTSFTPKGRDVRGMLDACKEAVLLAATLGAESERLLLREQARSGAQAVLMDAVLSAAIETVCDRLENDLRGELAGQGLFLTDRFSPGYGDMPLEQTREICDVLAAARSIGLTVSASGLMIPRKSVTAIMGISDQAVKRRPAGCEGCSARGTCPMSESRCAPV